MVIDLSKQNSVLSQYMAEMRDVSVQNDSMRFRKNLERVGQLVGYEISKQMDYRAAEVQTAAKTARL